MRSTGAYLLFVLVVSKIEPRYIYFYQVSSTGSEVHTLHFQDTLKISGIQVSPVEIENVLLAHPDGLIIDVAVAGVSGGRTSDEKVPRAWVVLSAVGKQENEAATVEALHAWIKENLSPYKWLRGGIEVINEVCLYDFSLSGGQCLTLPGCPDSKVADRESSA